MKTKIIIIVIFFLTVSVQGQINFQKFYGGSDIEFCYSVQQTTDNGYILCGSTASFGAGDQDCYLIKVNEVGDALWTKTYGGADVDYGFDAQQTFDGGYIICGLKNLKTYVIKTNEVGDTIWSKYYLGNGRIIRQSSDSCYLIAGEIMTSPGNFSMLVIKTDNSGNELWTKTYKYNQLNSCYDFIKTNDQGYIFVGCTNSMSSWDRHLIYLVKTNLQGDTLWTKSYGDSRNIIGYSVEQTNDNGYILLGNSFQYDATNISMLIKTDSIGNTMWTKVYDSGYSQNTAGSIKQTADGGFLYIYEKNTNKDSLDKVCLAKTDSLGIVEWTKTYWNGHPTDLQITSDGGYVITGFSNYLSGFYSDIFLIKETFDVSSVIKNNYSVKCINVSPNPFNVYTTIELSELNNKTKRLELFDVNGKIVKTINKITTNKIVIERSNLKNGIYIFKITDDEKIIAIGKLLVVE